jgi:hypothetical protein
MNSLNKFILVVGCACLCLGGVIYTLQNGGAAESAGSESHSYPQSYHPATSELRKCSFARLEALITADAASRFPNRRIELGSVRAKDGILILPVTFFGNRQAEAFIYRVIFQKNSWQIVTRERLWSIPSSQITRGLRI